ncbi:MAG TPA: hypothetical protein VF490_10610 [Chryseosolibacter sp.]
MSYLMIKKDDVKTFKSFLSGNEIEVGVQIGEQANVFHPDDEVYVFYGNSDDFYKAHITKRKRATAASGSRSFFMLGLVKQ